MRTRTGRDLLHRWPRNPIITQQDMPYRVNTVFNGTPVKLDDGSYRMVVRVEGQQGYSFLALARSGDGLHFEVEPRPCMQPASDGPFKTWEEYGLEDPRMTCLEGTYFILYTAVSRYGHRIALARTDDFHAFQRIALISEAGNKDGVLFPEKIGGLYARLDRPIGQGIGSVWISYSPDLVNWGRSQCVFGPRPRYWDSYRVGASATPIRTERGWLEIYHGVRMTCAGPIYRAGAVILDLDNPAKVIGRSLPTILSPRTDYERIGDIGNVVFASGAVVEPDGEIRVYYGAADVCICVATARLDDVVALCMRDAET